MQAQSKDIRLDIQPQPDTRHPAISIAGYWVISFYFLSRTISNILYFLAIKDFWLRYILAWGGSRFKVATSVAWLLYQALFSFYFQWIFECTYKIGSNRLVVRVDERFDPLWPKSKQLGQGRTDQPSVQLAMVLHETTTTWRNADWTRIWSKELHLEYLQG